MLYQCLDVPLTTPISDLDLWGFLASLGVRVVRLFYHSPVCHLCKVKLLLTYHAIYVSICGYIETYEDRKLVSETNIYSHRNENEYESFGRNNKRRYHISLLKLVSYIRKGLLWFNGLSIWISFGFWETIARTICRMHIHLYVAWNKDYNYHYYYIIIIYYPSHWFL